MEISCKITFRSRYLLGLALNPVRDMVVLDPFNPRSVAFQVERLAEHIERLPVLSDDGRWLTQISADLDKAEHMEGGAQRSALQKLARQVDADAKGATDGTRVKMLADEIRQLAGAKKG